jgi:hypothetical protein
MQVAKSENIRIARAAKTAGGLSEIGTKFILIWVAHPVQLPVIFTAVGLTVVFDSVGYTFSCER